ncbi:MAG: protein NO VEIN domain-containing protein, partial [Candidatus Freyarchaeota archaeon]
EEFIEVKSTGGEEKRWFDVSIEQWKLMREKGNKFYIYRVYGAGTSKPRLEKIHDPVKLWKEGYIDAHPIRIRI